MTLLDQMALASGVLTANATVVDQLINAGLFYGPGLILAVAIRAGWKTARWITGRLLDLLDRRRERRQTIRHLRHLYYLTPSYRRTEDQR